MIRDARRRKPAPTNEELMLQAAGVYLHEQGFAVAVISADRIQTDDELALSSQYEFVIRFTGTAPERVTGVKP